MVRDIRLVTDRPEIPALLDFLKRTAPSTGLPMPAKQMCCSPAIFATLAASYAFHHPRSLTA